MNIIKTESFELAINSKGDKNSDRLAILLPGRLDTKDYACYTSHIEYLANMGFHAVSFDPPGTWESPGGLDIYTTTNYIKALNELIEFFGNKPTLLIGHSRGGTVSILAGTTNPNVIGIVPVMATYAEPTSPHPEAVKDNYVTSYRDLPPGNSKTKEQKEFALPTNYFHDGQKYNVVDVLRKCTKPKLIIYGTNDRFTTPERAKEVYDAIPEPKMIHELHTEHDYRYHPEIIEEVNEVVGRFLEKYILKLIS